MCVCICVCGKARENKREDRNGISSDRDIEESVGGGQRLGELVLR